MFSRFMKKVANKTNVATGLVVAAAVGAVTVAGALNGGTALAASSFDTFVTFITTYLQNSFVAFLLLATLVKGLWDLTHGKGWSFIATAMGIFVVAFVLPGAVTTATTALLLAI